MYGGRTIGQVLNKQTETDITEEFKNRLHWDSQSGFFTLSDLRTDDSGVYTVQSTKEEKRQQAYQLNMYDKVSVPQVIKLNSSSAESELCLLQCSVRNVRGLNLFWFKGDVLLNHINSSRFDDTLNLPLEITSNNDIFSCVASNPASKQTTTVNLTEHCFYHSDRKPDNGVRQRTVILTFPIICTAVAVIGMAVFLWRKKSACLPDTKDQKDHQLITQVIYMTAGP
ncbi:uncharacterized protein LOC118803770 [Colossoma macropomum]|uniref:uncharacterized protein LOC118803770 n=1 Tax=Colossoma macropomum TaxID=42526 RepID=UPI001863EA24|nr:uncharacterized protein LOC118803770 [Colossoma macropomum]